MVSDRGGKEKTGMQRIREPRRAKIGIYTMGLQCYWAQFEGLRDRLLHYGRFLASKVEAMGAEVFFLRTGGL